MHFRHLSLFSLLLASAYSFAQPAAVPAPPATPPVAAPLNLGAPTSVGDNPFDRKPANAATSAPAPVAPNAPPLQGAQPRSSGAYPLHQSAPSGFPYQNGQGGFPSSAGPMGIGQPSAFEAAPALPWDEQVQAQRIGRVNKEHIFRGAGTYVFEAKSKVKVTRNPAQAAGGMSSPLGLPGGTAAVPGSAPPGLPSMVGRPGSTTSMFTSPAQPASSSTPRAAGK